MLIVDMPMPTNCAECKLTKFVEICPIGDEYALMEKERTERPDWCPIKGEIVPCNECKYRGLESIGVCWHKKIACIAGKRRKKR